MQTQITKGVRRNCAKVQFLCLFSFFFFEELPLIIYENRWILFSCACSFFQIIKIFFSVCILNIQQSFLLNCYSFKSDFEINFLLIMHLLIIYLYPNFQVIVCENTLFIKISNRLRDRRIKYKRTQLYSFLLKVGRGLWVCISAINSCVTQGSAT